MATGTLGMPTPWRELAARYEHLAACIVSVLVLAAVNWSHDVPGFPFDAANYWDLAHPDNLLSPSYRGYLYPLLLMPLRLLCELTPHPVSTMGWLFALVYGLTLPTLLPAFFARAFGARVTFLRRIVPVVLLSHFFPGVLIYPLSDLPAVVLAVGALLCALRAREASGSRQALLFAVAAGALAGAAYNTRTIYLFAFPGLLLLAWLRPAPGASTVSPRLALVGAIAFGALLVQLPQRIINERVHGVASFAVMARVEGQSLFATQLVWGLTLQRYETAVRGGEPVGGVYYLDPAGESLFKRLAPRQNAFSIPEYLKLAVQRPLEFIGLYTRHFINGLDVRDSTVYVETPSPLKRRIALLNFTALVVAAWVALATLAGGTLSPLAPSARLAVLATLLLPVAAIVPGAVETRFFLPLHLLAYGTIAFRWDIGALRDAWHLWRWWLVGATLAAAGLYFGVTTSTMAHMTYGWPETYRHGLP